MGLDDYEIERELGRGAMGVVYAGLHKVLGRRVAIKVLAGERDAEAAERFVREGRAVAAISHPNVVQIYESGSDDHQAFQVLELLDGESLAARLRRGPLPIAEALDLAAQLCEGLREVHRHGIVHRDLKPDNAFLIADSQRRFGVRVKLLDFGIVKLAMTSADARLTGTGSLLGTPGYMSPEQCEGLRTLDHRSDLYSLGIVLFEMITGVRPFDAPALAAVIAMQMHEPPPRLATLRPDASPALDALVARLLAKPVAERYPDASAVAAAIAGVRHPAATPTPRRRIAGFVLAAAIVVAVGVPVAIALSQRGAGSAAPVRDARGPAVARAIVPEAVPPPDAPALADAALADAALADAALADAALAAAAAPPALVAAHAPASPRPAGVVEDELAELRRAGLGGDPVALQRAARAALAAQPQRHVEIEVLRDAAEDLARRRSNGGGPSPGDRAAVAFVGGHHAAAVAACAAADHLSPEMIRPCVLAACLARDATHAHAWEDDLGDFGPGQAIRGVCVALGAL